MRGSVPPCVSRARVETSGDAELPRKRWGNGSRAAAMRSRHRASVSPAFGRGAGVEPYRGSETYLGEQATLGQELGDVGGKHDVSVDGGRGGSEVSGDPISKGYAAGTLRDPEARARGKRAGEDVATRADRHARARTRVSRASSTARDSDIARGIAVVPVAGSLEAGEPATSRANSVRRVQQIKQRIEARGKTSRADARVPVLVDVVVVLLGVLNLRHVVLSSRCRVGRAERSGRESGYAKLSLKRSFRARASKFPAHDLEMCCETSLTSYGQLP